MFLPKAIKQPSMEVDRHTRGVAFSSKPFLVKKLSGILGRSVWRESSALTKNNDLDKADCIFHYRMGRLLGFS